MQWRAFSTLSQLRVVSSPLLWCKGTTTALQTAGFLSWDGHHGLPYHPWESTQSSTTATKPGIRSLVTHYPRSIHSLFTIHALSTQYPYTFHSLSTPSVKTAADSFVALGFPDAGYHHFHLDDCWANKDRNSSGFLQGELDHFPNGMKPVVDHVHNLGLTFGLYTCAGKTTCVGGRPGSKDNWQKDADVFAEWGVDWVKMVSCS